MGLLPTYATLSQAVNALHLGKIIAYPTEGVYGLGCDPFNQKAIHQLYRLKARPQNKSFIMLAYQWSQIAHWIDTQAMPTSRLKAVLDTWPGPFTWVFPASNQLPSWLRGDHASVALRVTAHPIARDLCYHTGSPIISTSANLSGNTPARSADDVVTQFNNQVACIIDGPLGQLKGPSTIKDAITGKTIR